MLDLAQARASSPSNSPTFGPIVSIPLAEDLRDLGELRRRRRRASLGGDGESFPVPRDRLRQAVVELDLRLPPEQLARLLDVRDAQLDVGVVQRLEDDLAVVAASVA